MEKTEKKPLKLQEAVEKKFDLIGIKPGVHKFADFGTIDLTAIGLKDAQALVKAGFPYLKAKGKDDQAETPAITK